MAAASVVVIWPSNRLPMSVTSLCMGVTGLSAAGMTNLPVHCCNPKVAETEASTVKAKQTGLSIERIDRVMSKIEAYCMSGGARKGTYYSLNNQGLARAREVLRAMYT